MLAASVAQTPVRRSGLSILSVLLLSGVLASAYVPGKISQRYRTSRGGRQLDEARVHHDCEAPASLDARFFAHAALEHLSDVVATLHHAQPLDAQPILPARSSSHPPALVSIAKVWPPDVVQVIRANRRAFAARPPPQV